MHVVSRPGDRWELRQSRATDAGPRSRTLASFKVLTAETAALAAQRAGGSVSVEEVVAAARRAGAPVAGSQTELAAAGLLRALGQGADLPERMRRLLADRLGAAPPLSDSARAAAAWVGVGARERGEALRDLLLLADRLPSRRSRPRPRGVVAPGAAR